MSWIELKQALLYGRQPLSKEMLHPQTVKTAVREIARLVTVGWIDEPTEDMVTRIQSACHMGECDDVWDELQSEKHPLLVMPKRKRKTTKSRKRKVARS
jgi:hypothetical protein